MIYDCFMFSDELDLLEIRLSELSPVVDKFVLVEATRTHDNKPKILYYQKNQDRFEAYKDKIIHVIVDDLPDGSNDWTRERHQRDAIVRGLTDAKDDDVIMVSDVDEIPRPSTLSKYDPAIGPRALEQLLFQYYINNVFGSFMATKILDYASFKQIGTASKVRDTVFPRIKDGGWHFSYMRGDEGIKARLSIQLQKTLSSLTPEDQIKVDNALKTGIDIYGRKLTPVIVKVDETFPKIMQDNPKRFPYLPPKAYIYLTGQEGGNDNTPAQLEKLLDLLGTIKNLPGESLVIGAWEGRAVVPMAQKVNPDKLIVMDDWRGYHKESQDHHTCQVAAKKDIFARFRENLAWNGVLNAEVIKADPYLALLGWNRPLKFVYIDKDSRYGPVKELIKLVSPFIVRGGLIVGNNWRWASRRRNDLDGGVQRAVIELFVNPNTLDNLWWSKKPLV
jgi:beta-1,4-mannosyl-glycoprotein beta-1,4-N-acetylglucosaminyltransferase